MAMSSGGGQGGMMADINVTPLVDVMLVLLIIFMVTAPLMNTGVDIDLPQETAQPMVVDEDQLILMIDKDFNYYINESQFSKAEMAAKLAAIAEANPGRPVFLKADATVPYREVARLLAAAKLAGMNRVGLVFDPSALSDDSEEEEQ